MGPVAEPLRRSFHQRLEEIDATVVQLFALVTDGLAAATDAFLAGDRDISVAVADREEMIDRLHAEVEHLIEHTMALESPVARELRYLLAVLRMVSELERSGDLVEHIASRASSGLATQLSPKARGLFQEMAEVASVLWRKASEAFSEQDPEAADKLDKIDDRLDDLHDELTVELLSGSMDAGIAVPATLVARFYERLGDHAVHLTERTSKLSL